MTRLAFVAALVLLASTSFAGEPKISVEGEWQKPVRRPELSRAAQMYGEPKITVGDIKPARRPELTRWFLWLRTF